MTRDVMRRPTLVTYGSDRQPRLLPLLEASTEAQPDASDVTDPPNEDDDVKSTEDEDDDSDSADYDTDLDDTAGQ